MTDVKVHPAAECYRLMTEEELAGLTGDIEANGLREPIKLGKVNGSGEALIDGRNRLRACEAAGVAPQFETIEFKSEADLVAYVKSANERRDLTKGQRAIALAMLYPAPARGRGNKDDARKGAETASFSFRRLQEARQVLDYSRPLALAVRDGVKSLDDALAEVEAARKSHESIEAQQARLRAEAPDLADLVTEERMKLGEAIAALAARKDETARIQRTATGLFHGMVEMLHPRSAPPAEWAARLIANVREDYWPRPNPAAPLSKETVEACAAVVAAMAQQWKDRQGEDEADG